MITTLRHEEWRKIKGYNGVYEAEEFGYRKAGISAACNGRTKTYKGLFWQYRKKH